GDSRGNRNCDRLGDLVLHRENLSEVAVVALGPDMISGLGLNKLRGHPDAVAGFPEAAFENIPDTEFASDLLHIDGAVLVGEAGITGDHEQRWVAGQGGDDVLGDPISDEILLRIAAHVLEW